MLLKFLFINLMTDIALSDDLVHWRLGFKLSTMYIPFYILNNDMGTEALRLRP